MGRRRRTLDRELQRKLRSFSHTELSTDKHTSLDFIQHCLDTGEDVTGQLKEPFPRTPPPEEVARATGAALQHYLRGEEPDEGCRTGADPSMCILTPPLPVEQPPTFPPPSAAPRQAPHRGAGVVEIDVPVGGSA